ncbi:MAG: hypothetical protein AB8G23_02735 [Myxococcota bacterium]
MAMVAALGAGLFILASLLVGGRLLILAYKTRGIAELLLGLGLFCMGGIGYPLMAIITRAEGLSDTARCAVLVLHMCTSILGMGALAGFTRRVFRPGQTWAGVFLGSIILGFVGLALLQVTGPGLMAFLEDPKSGPWSAKVYLSFIPMTWAGFESIRYYRMLRKRLELGLADAVVTDRMRLWGISILAADSITVFGVAFNLMGFSITATSLGSILIGALGLVTSGALWLAFVPPQFYIARVRAAGLRHFEKAAA